MREIGILPLNILLTITSSLITQHLTRPTSRLRIAYLITMMCWQMKIRNSNVSSRSITQLRAARLTMTFYE